VPADKKVNTNNTATSPELVQQVITSLTNAMEMDKIYLNPSLNLAVMSVATGFSAKTISSVLNQHLQTSFNEFINGYRVEAFKEKIGQPGMEQLTIAGVAAECGFNSQATFQRTFKEITGIAPSVYRKSVVNIE
jgi:AraC-like DNA-binding protein